MKRIMFVCHGNICRSPMAEFIFKKMLAENNVSDCFYVASCATSTEEIHGGKGNPVYPPAKSELLKHGITCEGKCAVQLKKGDYDNYDMFIAMDSMNVRNIMKIFGKDKDGKVCKMMDFTDRKGDVADPWWTGNFDVAYNDIYDGCKGLFEHLKGDSNDEKYT